jgi:phosphate acetyltransferase
MYPKLTALIDSAKRRDVISLAVAFPNNEVALLAALDVSDAGFFRPVLFGDATHINSLLEASDDLRLREAQFAVRDCGSNPLAAASAAVAACGSGEFAALMKGSLHTDELMNAVVNKNGGLRGSERLFHTFVFELANYHKLLAVTDAVVNIAPDFQAKATAISAACALMRSLGVASPKVAILAAIELVNNDIAATVDAKKLVEASLNGRFGDAVVAGPFGFDNAISAGAAAIKGIDSPVAGDPDVLLVPDLNAGNILYKCLVYLAGAECAGLVLGAKVPIILTSRADSRFARLASCALARLQHD